MTKVKQPDIEPEALSVEFPHQAFQAQVDNMRKGFDLLFQNVLNPVHDGEHLEGPVGRFFIPLLTTVCEIRAAVEAANLLNATPLGERIREMVARKKADGSYKAAMGGAAAEDDDEESEAPKPNGQSAPVGQYL